MSALFRNVMSEPVVLHAAVAAEDAERDDVLLYVKNLHALDIGGHGNGRHQLHLSDYAHIAVALQDVACLDEALVRLRLVELTQHRPHQLQGHLHLLHQNRPTLVQLQLIPVEPTDLVLLPLQQTLEIL